MMECFTVDQAASEDAAFIFSGRTCFPATAAIIAYAD
jgi:hypothetical protein